jgi:hypothetical protein
LTHFRFHARTYRMMMAVLSVLFVSALVGSHLSDWFTDSCSDECEEECADFCECTHCLVRPAAIMAARVGHDGTPCVSTPAPSGLRAGADQACTRAIDHPPQLSL